MKQAGATNKINKLDISNWLLFTKKHIPFLDFANQDDFNNIIFKLKQTSSIVKQQDIDNLLKTLSTLKTSNSFILQMGECAETFDDFSENDIINKIAMLNNCANILSNKNIVKIGRIAGQYTKPRTENFETKNNIQLPAYFGDMVNDFTFDKALRSLDPNRMLLAYNFSLQTYSIILKHLQQNQKDHLFVSHEALNLFYEEAMTKQIDNKFYNMSTHMLWLGDKTRFVGSAHIEYLKHIENPIGIKISTSTSIKDTIDIIKYLNPSNLEGKIILINRMGLKNTKHYLNNYVQAIKTEKLNILWSIDPMHGNTIKLDNGFKTRIFEEIILEIKDFVNILKHNNEYVAGVHLEATYKDNSECAFVKNKLTEDFVASNYLTKCDPRLNLQQTTEIMNLLKTIV